ncbi:bifunctional DNA primase/polymerase [Amycolatopsis sp. NBC_00345]|uniref:bifunctional DNA primase/polymerase n=1 Tax=Amycolatopsis sp. NBC_00345 TaxID=2975955 RepID=UPI003FA4B740
MNAAARYAGNGWAVIPGSVWNGRSYTLGHTPTKTDGLVPAMLSQRSYRDCRQVRSWWTVAPYSILARAGEDFDVIQISAGLLGAAVEHGRQSVVRSPIAIGPYGARVLVSPGSELLPGLRNRIGIDILPPGTCIPLPPTRIRGGSVRWLREPSGLEYRAGDQRPVQIALLEAYRLWDFQNSCEQRPNSTSSNQH